MRKNIDAFCRWCYMVNMAEFAQTVFPGAHPSYAEEKWFAFQGNPIRFWGSLDDEHRDRIVSAVEDRS